MPKIKIGESKRKELGLLNEDGSKVKEEPAVQLQEGRYLGIERSEKGHTVVSLVMADGVLERTVEYRTSTSKGMAMEGFKLASGKFIVNFNQKAKGVKK